MNKELEIVKIEVIIMVFYNNIQLIKILILLIIVIDKRQSRFKWLMINLFKYQLIIKNPSLIKLVQTIKIDLWVLQLWIMILIFHNLILHKFKDKESGAKQENLIIKLFLCQNYKYQNLIRVMLYLNIIWMKKSINMVYI